MNNTRNIAMRIKYDGTNYHGWQFQENAVTIQGTVEKALSETFGKFTRVTGCSRTDAGVHALDYILSFKTDAAIPTEKLPYAVNYRLPRDITAIKAWETNSDFNARFSVKGKRYIYLIHNSVFGDPFLERYSWHYPYRLDLQKMSEAAAHFEGRHDFKGFMASGGQQTTTVRNIRVCTAESDPDRPELITVTVEADAFLYNMVRIIVGTLTDVGCGKLDPNEIPSIIASGDRRKGGITAPPQGLFLKKVYL